MRPSSLTRREFLRLAGLGFGAAALAACGSPSSQSGVQPTATSGATISTELHASDVALLSATGRPQLLEFFAFW